jgi:hypothetical protein
MESLLLGSLRGRWFLSEHARRNRAADTGMLLEAITQLEMAVLRPSRRDQQLLGHLVAMRRAITEMRLDMAASAPQDGPGGCDIDDVVSTTEAAKAGMLEAAEEIQDAAWTLRERGTGQEVYETLDRSAAGIYRACTAQDLTAQRIKAMAKALRIVDQRLAALIDGWSLADGAGRGTEPAAVDGKSRGKSRLLPAPEKAPGALDRPTPTARSSADIERKDPPGIAGLDAVKRQALFG